MRANHRFSIYWLGQTFSGFGDAFALVALPLLVLDTTKSVTGMGLVTAAGLAAQVFTSLFSGHIVDRIDRRRTMIACDLGRTLGYGLLPVLALRGPLPLWAIYLAVILGGALSNLFSVGYMTAVPSLVPQDELHAANARLQGALAMAYVLGALCAGLVTTALGPMTAIAIDAGTFLISAGSLSLIRFDTPKPTEDDEHRQLGAGWRFLLRHRLLRPMTLLLVVLGLLGNMGVGAGITDLMIFRVKQELAESAQMVGVCVGVTGSGALLGAVLAPSLSRRLGSGTCFVAGTFVQAAGLLIIGVPRVAAAAFGGLLWGAGMLLRAVPMHALRQSLIPGPLLGRVTAVTWTAVFAANAIGTAVVTRIASQVGAGLTMVGIGAAVAIVATFAWTGPIRRPQVQAAPLPTNP